MKETFSYPQGNIARIVEREAGKKFGPEKLTKDLVADALNVPAEYLSDEEWLEISEFAINAGAALIRSSLKDEETDISTNEELEIVRNKIKEIRDGLIPYHDIFHAAETYRLSRGMSASAEFTEVDVRSRYASSDLAAAELYPVLFLIVPPELSRPLPVLLSTSEGRSAVAKFLAQSFDGFVPGATEMIERLETAESPATAEERKQEYEKLVELIVISNAMRRLQLSEQLLQPLTKEEIEEIRRVMNAVAGDPDTRYCQFASKVFADTDWSKDPRLFLDEFLSCIRTEVTNFQMSGRDID